MSDITSIAPSPHGHSVPLRRGEVVHHRNGNPRDNHPDNLQVLPSQRAHALLHHYRRREARGIQHLYPLELLLMAHGEAVAPP